MGCASSKLFKKDLKRDIIHFENAQQDYPNHVVSLTSSTYGALNLDKDPQPQQCVNVVQPRKSLSRQEPEIINAWELMEGLEEGAPVVIQPKKSSPRPRAFLRGFADLDVKSPLKFLNQLGSPKTGKRSVGKENKGQVNGVARWDCSPKRVLKQSNVLENSRKNSPNIRLPVKCDMTKLDLGGVSFRRRSLSPLFDPEKVDPTKDGEEKVKKMVTESATSWKARNLEDAESILQVFDKICPPGGENAVVIYTTTLRGIRKTFEDCNIVRSIIESHHVQMFERDVSMDSGFREELRGLMGTKQVKVPVMFVKGRLVGGADEILKLDEEGKLGLLLDRIPRAGVGCQGCSGVRFVMCVKCNGSCKLFDEDGRKTLKCDECNENGLIQCPICC